MSKHLGVGGPRDWSLQAKEGLQKLRAPAGRPGAVCSQAQTPQSWEQGCQSRGPLVPKEHEEEKRLLFPSCFYGRAGQLGPKALGWTKPEAAVSKHGLVSSFAERDEFFRQPSSEWEAISQHSHLLRKHRLWGMKNVARLCPWPAAQRWGRQ